MLIIKKNYHIKYKVFFPGNLGTQIRTQTRLRFRVLDGQKNNSCCCAFELECLEKLKLKKGAELNHNMKGQKLIVSYM